MLQLCLYYHEHGFILFITKKKINVLPENSQCEMSKTFKSLSEILISNCEKVAIIGKMLQL